MLLLLFLIFTLISHILDLSRQVSDPYQIDTLKAYRRKLNATKSICFASNKQSALLNQQRSENDCSNISCTHISYSVFKYKVGTFHHTLKPLEGVAFDVKRLCIYCVPLTHQSA